MNDLRIAIRQVYSYIPIEKKYKYYVVYNYTRNKIEIINELDCTYLLKLNSIYKIDNLDELVNKNTDYNFLSSLSLLYKKAIDYIVINKCITDNKELADILNRLEHKLNYFLVFKVNYDDFIETFKSKVEEVTENKKLIRKGE